MDEVNVSKCHGPCGNLKVRRQVGTFDGKNKRYIDEDGRLWNGRVCPVCHKNKVKVQVKEKRANADSEANAKNTDVR